MYAGHAAVALALKTRDPRVPMLPLALACYGPDWLETVLGLFRGRVEMSLYTHYLPGLLTGALAAAALYTVLLRRPGGWVILSGWLLHWPADFFTAHKGLLSPTVRVGLDLYNLPLADFAVESLLVLACVALYARTFAHSPAQRRWVGGMAAALLVLQALLDHGLAHEQPVWRPAITAAPGAGDPSLACRAWRPHLTWAQRDERSDGLRMPLAFSASTFTASARWRSLECGVSRRWSV